ncbi:hypothetical protein JTB14_014381 [Gonioctena quinquepunctata]|nr:hypothetical protein JTB14_014381 [Gonioctena quinquepunctata]
MSVTFDSKIREERDEGKEKYFIEIGNESYSGSEENDNNTEQTNEDRRGEISNSGNINHKAKLVLIPKGKPEDMKLRPICLLNSITKVNEGLLRNRLENEIESTGGLSEHQYGYRKKRSTIHAVDKVVSIVESSREK